MPEPQVAKQPFPDKDYQELVDAWNFRSQVPQEYRSKYEDALKQIHAQYVEKYDEPIDPSARPTDQLGHAIMRGLDYGAGMVRTPLMAAAAKLAGRGDIVKHEDFDDAKVGKAPPTIEYLKRAGVPPGPSAHDVLPAWFYADPNDQTHPWYQPEKGGTFDPTARGFAGLVGDVGLSPNAITGGAKKVAKGAGLTPDLEAMTAPQVEAALKAQAAEAARRAGPLDAAKHVVATIMDPGSAVEKLGKKYYKSAFSEADDAIRSGKGGKVAAPLSDTLHDYNVWGTARGVADQARDLSGNIAGDIRKELATQDKLFPTQRVSKQAVRQGSRDYLSEMEGLPGSAAEAAMARAKLADKFAPFKGQRTFSMSEANDIKGNFQDLARAQRAYENSPVKPGRAINAGDNAMKSGVLGDAYSEVAKGARKELEDALDTIEPGQGGRMKLRNRELGSMAEGAPYLQDAAKKSAWDLMKEMGPASIVTGAAGTLPAYVLDSPNLARNAALGAVAGGLSASTVGRTGAGLAMSKGPAALLPRGWTRELGKAATGYSGSDFVNRIRAMLEESTGESRRAPSPWQLMGQEMDLNKKEKGK